MGTIQIAIINGPSLFPEGSLRRALADADEENKLEVTKLELQDIWYYKKLKKDEPAKWGYRLTTKAKQLIDEFNEGCFDYLAIGHCKGLGLQVARKVNREMRDRVVVMHAITLPEDVVIAYHKLDIRHVVTNAQADRWVMAQREMAL